MTNKYNPQVECLACGCKMPIRNWTKHIETKRHHNSYNKACKNGFIYDKLIFDSSWVTKHDILYTFIPKVKLSKVEWNVVKNE